MKLLFICTGNTCRSPMAMCLATAKGHDARSAGISVYSEGEPASQGAINAMQARGLSLANHTAKQVTKEDVAWADRVICMSAHHMAYLLGSFPAFADKIKAFQTPIPDPYMASDAVYAQTAEVILTQLNEVI